MRRPRVSSATAFAELGYDVSEFTVVPSSRFDRPDVTAVFPDPAAYDAIVFFGAVWSVYDEAAIGTWIGDEIAFARSAHGLGVPLLGICFGGQMLAAAAGGSVSRALVPEIGWLPVETAAPALIDAGPWFQWHFDRFTVPSGVPVLARTAAGGPGVPGRADARAAVPSGADRLGAGMLARERRDRPAGRCRGGRLGAGGADAFA